MQDNLPKMKPKARIMIISKDPPAKPKQQPTSSPRGALEMSSDDRSSSNSGHRITFSPFHKSPRPVADHSTDTSAPTARSEGRGQQQGWGLSSDDNDSGSTKGDRHGRSTTADYNCKLLILLQLWISAQCRQQLTPDTQLSEHAKFLLSVLGHHCTLTESSQVPSFLPEVNGSDLHQSRAECLVCLEAITWLTMLLLVVSWNEV